MAKKQKMSAKDAMDIVPDDLPDGAYFVMMSEVMSVDYEDVLDELLAEMDDDTEEE